MLITALNRGRHPRLRTYTPTVLSSYTFTLFVFIAAPDVNLAVKEEDGKTVAIQMAITNTVKLLKQHIQVGFVWI